MRLVVASLRIFKKVIQKTPPVWFFANPDKSTMPRIVEFIDEIAVGGKSLKIKFETVFWFLLVCKS